MSSKMYPAEWTKVRCLGEHHSLLLMKNDSGRASIALPAHRRGSKNSLDQIVAMQAIVPEWRCRCWEVLCAWRVYTSWSGYRIQNLLKDHHNIEEAVALVAPLREVSKKKVRAHGKVSPSEVLALIPESFRSEAKAARERHESRWNRSLQVVGTQFRCSPTESDRPKWMRHAMEADDHRTSVRFFPMDDTASRFYRGGSYKEITDKWFRRTLEPCGLSGPDLSSPGLKSYAESFMRGHSLKKNGQRYPKVLKWMRLYWTYDWFRELVKFGFAPSNIPPLDCWETDPRTGEPTFPRVLLCASWNGKSSLSQAKHRWVKIRGSGETYFFSPASEIISFW